MDKKLIIFDFDGVLVDSLFIAHEINQEVNKNFTLETYQSLLDGNIYEALNDKNNEWVAHPNFHARYEEKTRELTVPAQMKEYLEALRAQYTLVVVSSTPTNMIQKILEREGVLPCFSKILGSDVHTSKVVKITALLKEYAVVPSETIFITDTVGDVREGRQCGVPAVAVTWGFQKKEALIASEPFAVVDTISDLKESVRSFFGE